MRPAHRFKITAVMNEDYDNAAKYAKIFDEHRRVYKHHKTWNFKAFKEKTKGLREIKIFMNRMREWLKELEKMKVRSRGFCAAV